MSFTQALLKGFSDHHAVENYISQNVRGRLQTDGEKIKVDIGTLRTKVLVQESKIHNYVYTEDLLLLATTKSEKCRA